MAIYRFDTRNSKTHNTSASDHDDYVKREGRYAPDNSNDSFDVPQKYEDLIYKEDNNIPKFATNDPNKFWRSSEAFERANGRTYTEFEIALPHELSDEVNIEIAKDFGKEIFGNNFVYSFGIHKKSSSKKNVNNIHVHYMFSERILDGIERESEQFFKRYNPKNPELGGCKKDRTWNDINMPKIYRKKWEVFLNNELEKYGIEKVSCESLANQKLEAERNGNTLKAELLDREPININGYILMKIDKSGINSLTSWEKEEFEHFNEVKKFTELKYKIYNNSLEQEPQVLDFSVTENQDLFNQNDSIERKTTKLHCERTIERLEAQLLPQNLKRIILNAITSTSEEYQKNIDTFEKLEKLKENRILTKEEESELKTVSNYIATIESNLKYDNEFIGKYEHTKEEIKKKYESSINKRFEELKDVESLQINKNYSKNILNDLLKANEDNIKLLEDQKDFYSKAKTTLKEKQQYIIKLATNKASKGEYFKIINERNNLYSKYESLLEAQKSLSVFNVIQKKKISNQIDELSKQDKILKDKLVTYEKLNIDKEKKLLENSFNTSLNIIDEKLKDTNTNLIFRKEKREIILENLEKIKENEKPLKIEIKNIEISGKSSKEDILNICFQETKLEYYNTRIENLKDNLIPENLKIKALNILTKGEYEKNLELLNKQNLSLGEKNRLNEYFNSFENKELKDLTQRKSKTLEKLYSDKLTKYEKLVKENTKFEYDLKNFDKLDKNLKDKIHEELKSDLSKKIGSCEHKLEDLNKKLESTNYFIDKLKIKEQIQDVKEQIQINKNTMWKAKTLLKEPYKEKEKNYKKNHTEYKNYVRGMEDVDINKEKEDTPNAWRKITKNENSYER